MAQNILKPKNQFSSEYIDQYFVDVIENKKYVNFHKIRYLYLLNLISAVLDHSGQSKFKILDIGPMHQTNLIRDSFDHVTVDTMGKNYNINKLREFEKHMDIDLNYVEHVDRNSDNEYDLLIFCEVIEHLYTKPEIILNFLKQFMRDKGYIIIQTPNGVAIHHRLKMLFGIHPFQQIEKSRRGHYREYAPYELEEILNSVSLNIAYNHTKNYFNNDNSVFHRLFVKFGHWLPSNFRDGITIIGQKL